MIYVYHIYCHLKKIMSILQNILLHVCITEITFFLTLMHIQKLFSQKCDDIEIPDGSQEDDDMETSSVNQTQVMILI